jgi:aspartyl-tRNA(Asn)/glutamyl-tRNA(Gln) amidotransferase subunit C
MKLDAEAVAKIATLARLRLTDEENVALQGQLTDIFTYVEQLGELQTDGVEPTAHFDAQGTPLREDEPRPCLPVEEVLRNAPDSKGTAFRVPRIIE